MKHFLHVLFLTILLTSAICSCRSSKQSAIKSSDTTSVFVAESVSTLSTDEILSIFTGSRELDLSGIKVEFFPPDSTHPDSRASPKSFTIETISAKESTEQATQEKAAVDEKKSENLSAQNSSSLQQDTQCDNDFMQRPNWVIFISIFAAILIIFLSIIFKIKRK